jgi:hypothetical protein
MAATSPGCGIVVTVMSLPVPATVDTVPAIVEAMMTPTMLLDNDRTHPRTPPPTKKNDAHVRKTTQIGTVMTSAVSATASPQPAAPGQRAEIANSQLWEDGTRVAMDHSW